MAENPTNPASVDLTIGDSVTSFPVFTGTYNEKGIDISALLGKTGYITLDSGYKNTGAVKSAITFIDGDEGTLEHRGYSIQELASNASFTEVMFLLLHGELPTQDELEAFENQLKANYTLPEGIFRLLDALPDATHPMSMLMTAMSAMPGFYPEAEDTWNDENIRWQSIHRVLGHMPALVAAIYRRSQKLPYIPANNTLGYVENFLHMTYGEVNAAVASALDTLLILHADHEQNCSTSTVRLAGSSHVNMFAALSAGVGALWGPLHGGANQEVIEMLEMIREDGGDTSKYIAMAKDKGSNFRLMGFGHRVYKNFDPRSRVIKAYADEILSELNVQDPVLDIARGLEEEALRDSYFIDRKLFPNVDFYSGIIYRALGIPVNLFTVMFAFGRLPGWVAQWKEMREGKEPINRPRQIYTGKTKRDFVTLDKR